MRDVLPDPLPPEKVELGVKKEESVRKNKQVNWVTPEQEGRTAAVMKPNSSTGSKEAEDIIN